MWDYVSYQIEEVSSPTFSERALLLASIEAKVEPEKFDCATCITQYGTSEKLQGKTQAKRKSKGCFDYKTKGYRLDQFKYTNCIGNHTVPIDYIMDAFTLYEKGQLPFEGTLGDQPNKIIEIFDIIYRRRQDFFDREAKKRK